MSGEESVPQIAPVESPHVVSYVKLPILKKGEYTLWSMRIEQYLTNTDYALWQLYSKEQKERKVKALCFGYSDEYQLRFNTIKDAKSSCGLYQRVGLDKAYNRFQKLISKLEVHGAAVSNKNANQKFLRALPSSWNNIALIMRNKEGIDELDIDDLYNNLKVFEADIKVNIVATVYEDLEQIDNDDLEQGQPQNDLTSDTSDALVVQDNALIIQDGLGYNWSYIAQDEPIEFALMAYTSRFDTKLKRKYPTPPSNTSVEMPRVESVRPSRVIIKDWGTKPYLLTIKDIDGGFVAFGEVTRGATQSETSGILKKFITEVENQLNHKVKVIRTSQQNGVAERKNMTLIEAARTMLADSLLPTVFWAEAVNIAFYVLNRVLVTKPHNKTPYKLIIGRSSSISFMRPFGCPVTILNTLDPLGKFDGKAEEGFLVGYSVNSKAFRGFDSQTRKVEENMHVNFLENKPNVARQGPNWLFDIDSLTNSMNYQPSEEKNMSTQQYTVFPLWSSISSSYKSLDETYKNDTNDDAAGETPVQKPASENEQALKNVLDKMMDQEKEATEQSDAVRKEFEAQFNAASAPRTSNDVNDFQDDPLMPDLEDTAEVQNTGIFGSAFDDEDLDTYNSPFADQVMGAEADFNNMEPSTVVSPIPTTRVHSIHPKDQIIRDPKSAVQTRGMTKKSSGEHAMISYIQKQRRSNHKDFQNCLFACFLSQQEPTKIAQALDDESWVEAMQEELLQFKIQKVWTLVDLPYGKKAIGTKWVYRNKKDERGIVVRNKARLVAQGYKQEEGIDDI
ncbi:putative ribonuclease H-like domain-containing protein [Tanacetum coccineum]